MQIFNFFHTYANFLPTFFIKKCNPYYSFINFCYQGKGTSQRVNKSTSQQVNKLKSDKSDESDRSDKRWV